MSEAFKLYEAIRTKSDKRWRIVDTFDAGEVIHVADVAFYDEEEDSTSLIRMLITDVENVVISITSLAPPESASFDQLQDTRNWKVDKSTLFTPLMHTTMLEGMFYSGAVEPSFDANAKVLQIGLGGGLLYNFVESVFPKIGLTGVELEGSMVETAKEWFQVRTSATQKVLVDDGVAVVDRAVEQGEKFDVILVDTAYNGFTHAGRDTMLAPVPPFRELTFFENAKRILNPTGALICNVVAADGNDATVTEAKKFEEKLRQVFAHTNSVYNDGNVIVTATSQPTPSVDGIKKRLASLNFKTRKEPMSQLTELYAG